MSMVACLLHSNWW